VAVSLKDDSQTLRDAGVRDGTKLMLIGAKASEVQAIASAKPTVAAPTNLLPRPLAGGRRAGGWRPQQAHA